MNRKRPGLLIAVLTAGLLAAAVVGAVAATPDAEVAKLTASDAHVDDNFGFSVAVSGDTAVIGAWADDDAGEGSGSAYVFVRSGGSWSQQAKLTASDAAVGDQFGRSVAISGDTVVIGAHLDGDSTVNNEGQGAAYVFARSGGSWSEQAKLTASPSMTGTLMRS